MVTDERAAEVRDLLLMVQQWASQQPYISAVGMAGSWARDEARMDSDVDLILLTRNPTPYIEGEEWITELGGLGILKTEPWGPMTERRFILSSGLEVDASIASPSWAATSPVDDGTRRVVTDGFRILYDPNELLARLLEACQ